jgi:hypothetical protein
MYLQDYFVSISKNIKDDEIKHLLMEQITNLDDMINAYYSELMDLRLEGVYDSRISEAHQLYSERGLNSEKRSSSYGEHPDNE